MKVKSVMKMSTQRFCINCNPWCLMMQYEFWSVFFPFLEGKRTAPPSYVHLSPRVGKLGTTVRLVHSCSHENLCRDFGQSGFWLLYYTTCLNLGGSCHRTALFFAHLTESRLLINTILVLEVRNQLLPLAASGKFPPALYTSEGRPGQAPP